MRRTEEWIETGLNLADQTLLLHSPQLHALGFSHGVDANIFHPTTIQANVILWRFSPHATPPSPVQPSRQRGLHVWK
ncbi:unnamed protein product [Knipowitschia caucasica]